MCLASALAAALAGVAAGWPTAAAAAPGGLDPAFGRGGVLVVPMGDATPPAGPAARGSGDAFMAGASRCAIECQDLRVLQIGARGLRREGRVPGIPATAIPAAAVAVPATGVVTAGRLESQTLPGGAAVARLTAALAPDQAFGQAGIASTPVPPPGFPVAVPASRVTAAVARPGGRLAVAGDCRAPLAGGRTRGCIFALGLTAAGVPDPAFGDGRSPGFTLAGVSGGGVPAGAVAAGGALGLPGGRLALAARAAVPGGSRVVVAVLTATGAPDASWGPGGVRLTDIPGATSEGAAAVVRDGASRIVAVGDASIGGRRRVALVRHRPDGRRDPSFGRAGIATPVLPGASAARAVAALAGSGGRLLVAGTARIAGRDRIFVARYRADGGLDRAFGDSGATILRLPGPSRQDAAATGLVAAGQGDLVVGGWRRLASAPDRIDYVVARLRR